MARVIHFEDGMVARISRWRTGWNHIVIRNAEDVEFHFDAVHEGHMTNGWTISTTSHHDASVIHFAEARSFKTCVDFAVRHVRTGSFV